MAKHLYLVFTNPKDGREAEFNAWYDGRHIPDVLRVPGFVSAQRYELSEHQRMTNQPWRYVAIFEVETDDLVALSAEFSRRLGSSEMPLSDAMDPVIQTHFIKPLAAAPPAQLGL